MKRLMAIVLGLIFVLAPAGWTKDFKGALVVRIGCGDPAGLVGMRLNKTGIVQGLDTDPAAVAKAREYIQSHKIYGRVSAQLFDGTTLPYVDNLVNVLVASGQCQVAKEEIMRVLVPGGTAIVDGKKMVKAGSLGYR